MLENEASTSGGVDWHTHETTWTRRPRVNKTIHAVSFRAHGGKLIRRNGLGVLKAVEVMKLKGSASSYCYNDPVVLQIENTNVCNLSCEFCPRHRDKKYIPKEMGLDEFREILDPWIGSLFSIHIFGRGEPLVGKHIFEMIDHAAGRGVPHVSITSNGFLLTRERARELARIRLMELRISVDGATPETFRKIRQDDLGKLMENVRYFTSISDIPVSLNFALNAVNWNEIKMMPKLVKELGGHALRVFPVNTYDETIEDDMGLGRDRQRQYGAVGREVEELCKQEGLQFIMDKEVVSECVIPFVMAFINVDGMLTPCCKLEEIPLEDVKADGFRAAWNGPRMRAFRDALITKNYPTPCTKIQCIRDFRPKAGEG